MTNKLLLLLKPKTLWIQRVIASNAIDSKDRYLSLAKTHSAFKSACCEHG